MARRFDIPDFYRSSVIGTLKASRSKTDQRKTDLSPARLGVGNLQFNIARHFGFCFGVENAIEIAYRAVEENPGKRIYLLSEMIHNPLVNRDLQERGVAFLQTTEGEELIPLDTLVPDDVVIIPAFGTTLEMMAKLEAKGIQVERYNTTCPFVEKVWKRSATLGQSGYTIVVHGKHYHEETKATFSHASTSAPCVVIRDRAEAEVLAGIIRQVLPPEAFFEKFAGRCSPDFSPVRDLQKIGVVNQTTMLAYETQAISALLRQAMVSRYGSDDLKEHFADTRDTLCYATAENQDATQALVDAGGDICLVVGGYNSSNTAHLAKLCAARYPTYHIESDVELLSAETIRHFDPTKREVVESNGWLPSKTPLRVLLTAGASCPDMLVDKVLRRVVALASPEVVGEKDPLWEALEAYLSAQPSLAA